MMEIAKLLSAEPMLGKIPDRMIAESYGVSLNFIAKIRRHLGIKPSHMHLNYHKRKVSLLKIYPLLGNIKDVDIARRFGITKERVRQIRNRYGIARYKRTAA